MDRRELLAGMATAGISLSAPRSLSAQTNVSAQTNQSGLPNTYLELKTWHLRTSEENQAVRLAEYLEHGLAPVLHESGSALIGAFTNVIGPDGPYYLSLAQFPSLSAFQHSVEQLNHSPVHQQKLKTLASASQFPFAGVESSLLRSFDVLPSAVITDATAASNENESQRPARLFELRTYQSPSYSALAQKVGMFNEGEAKIFERLKMRPIFFGETLVGPRQPNLTYMLSFDDMAARDRLWGAFGSDPEWKTLSGRPELKDAEIVANISNVILRALPFSLIR